MKRKKDSWREDIKFTDGLFNHYLDIDVIESRKHKQGDRKLKKEWKKKPRSI
tara:strand:+ start:138 stop:293 length:156 start_codon:yes stop_codon:yes gene_type:complete